jgi:hypothetical protein
VLAGPKEKKGPPDKSAALRYEGFQNLQRGTVNAAALGGKRPPFASTASVVPDSWAIENHLLCNAAMFALRCT